MKVSECMTRDVTTVAPDQTIQEAARIMAEMDVGAVPVGEEDRLVGMITDRDIAVRAVCAGKAGDTPIREVMTEGICYCFEDEEIEHVARNMGEQKIRRLPVLNRSKRLVGIVSLGDLASHRAEQDAVGEALGEISEPGGKHSQAHDGARH